MSKQSLTKILDRLQEATIVIDCQGSVLGPQEDARAFQAVKDDAVAAIVEAVEGLIGRDEPEDPADFYLSLVHARNELRTAQRKAIKEWQ